MKSRLLVAAVGVPILIVILLFCPTFITAAAVCALCAIAAHELLSTTGLLEHKPMLICTEIIAILVPVWSYLTSEHILTDSHMATILAAAVLFIFVLVLFLLALKSYPAVKFSGISAAIVAGVIIPLSLSGLVRLISMEHGRFLVLIPIIIPFIADAGAYFAGRFLGKHKMAPVLSPKKTVEGAVGGLLAGIVSMLIFGVVVSCAFSIPFNFGFAAIYGILGSIISIIGDLSFSMIKRETGIKDYGTIFRAHGGVLDRFDSVIFTLPLIEILILVLPAM